MLMPAKVRVILFMEPLPASPVWQQSIHFRVVVIITADITAPATTTTVITMPGIVTAAVIITADIIIVDRITDHTTENIIGPGIRRGVTGTAGVQDPGQKPGIVIAPTNTAHSGGRTAHSNHTKVRVASAAECIEIP